MLPAWSRFAFAAQERPLGIPPLLTADNARKITLNIQQGKMAFIPAKPPKPGDITVIYWARH